MEYKRRLADLPASERPRERLLRVGPENLSNTELLAILLRIGKQGKSAIDLAAELLAVGGGLRGLDAKSTAELCEFMGMGTAKAAQIKAALELGRRLQSNSGDEAVFLRSSQDTFAYLHLRLCNQPREQFFVLLLNSRNKLLTEKKIFEGSLQETMVNAREVVKVALNEQAAGVIFAHNHPSGDPGPSKDDLNLTKKLQQACALVDVQVLDHLIIGNDRFMSFADEGLL